MSVYHHVDIQKFESKEILSQSYSIDFPVLENHFSNIYLPNGESIILEEMDSSAFYKLYDDLVKRYPEKFSVHLWGVDDTGNPLKYYVLEPTGINKSLSTHFLTSGVHGNEKTAQYSGYLKVKQLLDEDMLNEVRFIILPVCNPYGNNHNTRKNGNGVNLNRNFPINWVHSDESGNQPLDQPETRFMVDVILSHTDSNQLKEVLVTDLHTFIYNPDEHKVLWSIVTTPELEQYALQSGEKIYGELANLYPELIKGHPYKQFHHIDYPVSPTFIHYMGSLGFKGCICEAPNNLTSSDIRYTQAAFDINYLIVNQFVDEVMTLLE